MRSASRLASQITSVCFPAGLKAGRQLSNGVQHHGQLPAESMRLPHRMTIYVFIRIIVFLNCDFMIQI